MDFLRAWSRIQAALESQFWRQEGQNGLFHLPLLTRREDKAFDMLRGLFPDQLIDGSYPPSSTPEEYQLAVGLVLREFNL